MISVKKIIIKIYIIISNGYEMYPKLNQMQQGLIKIKCFHNFSVYLDMSIIVMNVVIM